MIISDLNYLEVIQQENGIVGGAVSVSKDVDIDVDTDLDTDVDIDITVNKDIDIDFDSTVDISGNFASLVGDATAIGDNSAVEVDFTVTTTDGLSEVSLSAFSAVG
ncbi:MAG: hypothetical protein F6K19_02910 [Cyanothece sp. SIO1E1]|nr:hypothetical protein [Cyanothece sp. SIO1E1]